MPGLTPAMRAAMAAFKRDTALNEQIDAAYRKAFAEVPYSQQVPLAAWKELPEGKAAVAAILAGTAASSGAASAPSSDSIQATPEANPIIASFARGLKSADAFARKPFGYDNPPAAAISTLLGVPAIQRTMERVGYGEPLTNAGKANVPLMTEDTGEALMATPQFLSPAMKLAQMTKGLPVGAIIRNTGDNNFLKGSVENALAGLKRIDVNPLAMGFRPGINERNQFVNKFIDGPLTKYVKSDMATERDPIRALAEQGVLHFDPNTNGRDVFNANYAREQQKTAQLGVAPLAKQWENVSDVSLNNPQASIRGYSDVLADNPWLAKLQPTDPVYRISGSADVGNNLGFTHLTDELRNALNPESGLPRNLLLTPEKLQNMGMERAVRHVSDINDWRAAQEAQANAQKANNAATVLHKEYPTVPGTDQPNPKGLRWVELKAPDVSTDLPEGYSLETKPYQDGEIHRVIGPDGQPSDLGWGGHSNSSSSDPLIASGGRDSVVYTFNKGLPKQQLSDALKYEGDVMKHCVGGYTDDVLNGSKRIFSLRDANGEPHVTIHTEPNKVEPRMSGRGYDQLLVKYNDAVKAGEVDPDLHDPLSWWRDSQDPLPDRIVQIKRKANVVNSDPYEYRPFVQDFVKSGQWSDVGDMANTGLVKINGGSTNIYDGPNKYKGLTMPDTGYYTPRELADHFESQGVPQLAARQHAGDIDGLTEALTPEPGYKQGGRVSMIHPAACIQPLVRVPGFDPMPKSPRSQLLSQANRLAQTSNGNLSLNQAMSLASMYPQGA